jgi:hypothetical protein
VFIGDITTACKALFDIAVLSQRFPRVAPHDRVATLKRGLYNEEVTDTASTAHTAILTSDTSAEIERLQIEAWRKMAPPDKMRLVAQSSCAVIELAMAGIRARHSGATERERFLRLAAMTLGRPLAEAAYPDVSRLQR